MSDAMRRTTHRTIPAAAIAACSVLLTSPQAHGQCYGTTLFPPDVINVPDDGTQVIISTQSWPGDRVQVFLPGDHVRTYQFTSSVPTDHLTISSSPTAGALLSGPSPLIFTPPGVNTYYLHIHTNPACGTTPVTDRTTTVFRTHCKAGALNCGGSDEAITRVAVGTIDNTSAGCGVNGYSDFRALSSNIMAGGSLPILVRNLNPFSGDLVRVYVDWDRNFLFDDTGGSFLLNTTDHQTFTGMIIAPAGTTPGPVRLRVRLNYLDDGAQCGFGQFGEVEDYTLVVTAFGNGMYAGGVGRGESRQGWQAAQGIAMRYGGGAGQGGSMGRYAVPISLPLALVAALEGPYNTGTGLMNDALRTLAYFPLTEPYSAMGYSFMGGGGETVAPAVLATTGGNAIVDWVIVELRDAASPSTVIASRGALLRRNGSVVHTNGTSPVSFVAPAGQYHVAVLHRNHLAAMTANSYIMAGSTVNVDLSSAGTPTYGTDARKSVTGTFPKQVLWAGDVTFNGEVKYAGSGNDRDPILTVIGGTVPTNTITGYLPADVNMDGTVKYAGSGNDRDPILSNIGGTVPTAIRTQQLP